MSIFTSVASYDSQKLYVPEGGWLRSYLRDPANISEAVASEECLSSFTKAHSA